MTAPYADLIERLRSNEVIYDDRGNACASRAATPLRVEATKAIEALQADNERLQAEVTSLLLTLGG